MENDHFSRKLLYFKFVQFSIFDRWLARIAASSWCWWTQVFCPDLVSRHLHKRFARLIFDWEEWNLPRIDAETMILV